MSIIVDVALISPYLEHVTDEVRESTGVVEARAGRAASRRRGSLSKGDRREQAILDGARELLQTQPIDRLTVDALASAAGISRSSFYFYFDSKQAVLVALLGGLWQEQATLADRGWLSASGPEEHLLRDAVATSVRMWREHGPLLRHAMLSEDPDPAILAFRTRIMSGYVERASARIRRDQAAGLTPTGPPDPENLAAMTYYVELTTLASATTGPGATFGPDADAYLIDSLTNVRLRMLYGTP